MKNIAQFLIDLTKFYQLNCQATSWFIIYCKINCCRFPRRNGKIVSIATRGNLVLTCVYIITKSIRAL